MGKISWTWPVTWSALKVWPAVALAFEEMRTPYASGREVCVQKFGNAYQRKEIEKRMTHFKSIFQIQWNKMFFANDARFPFTYLCMFCDHLGYVLFETCWDRVPLFLRTLYASLQSMILHTARFLCVLYAALCVNATAGLEVFPH